MVMDDTREDERMSEPLLLTECDSSGVVVVTLNRPERRNALSVALMEALCVAVNAAAEGPDNRAIILRGAGRVFCAGLDLAEAARAESLQPAIEWIGRLLETVHGSPLTTIAAVHGAAIAGGAGLMSACDFAVIADDVRIGYPEVRRGLLAGVVLTFLRRQLRERDARELLLLGEPIDAHRALEMGLVSRVVPFDAVMREARRIAVAAMKGAPMTAARTKRLLDQLWPRSVGQDVKLATDSHLDARDSAEAREGMAAFLEKREPRWGAGQGRAS